jgi:hypothetical protein
MHKYFNFSKIYEAEQTGKELLPSDLGTQEAPIQLEAPEDKLEDFAVLAKDHLIEVFLSNQDLIDLSSGKSVTKNDAQWKLKTGNTLEDITPIKEVIFNTSNEKTESDKDALLFALGDPRTSTAEGIANRIINAFKDLGTGELLEVLTGTAQDGTVIPEISVKFLRSPELDTSPATAPVKPASSTDIESGLVTPPATSEAVSPKRIMNFNQFVNEGKKKWIGDIDMKKDALKKELGDDDLSMDDLNKEEARLKKKDKDKKKPGLQLGAKDAKTRKRVVLAKNLMKASGADKK